jgi:hypothetical protein
MLNKILTYIVSSAVLILMSACAEGPSSFDRKLSMDEQQQVKDLNDQRFIASPREQRMLDCKIKNIGTPPRDNDPLTIGSGAVDPDCMTEQEKGEPGPLFMHDQLKMNKMIDKNLNDALEKASK